MKVPAIMCFVLTGMAMAASANADTGKFLSLEDLIFQEHGDNTSTDIPTWSQYQDWRRGLAAQFDELCPDSYCEGSHSNIQSMSFECSVNQTSHQIGSCTWLFVGWNVETDPDSGAVSGDSRVYQCNVSIKASLAELTAFLNAASATGPSGRMGMLHEPIPGGTRTLSEVLSDCL